MNRFIVLLFTVIVGHAAAGADGDTIRRLLQERKPAEAEAAAKQWTAAQPENADAWAALGRAALVNNDADVAVQAGEKAAALAPGNGDFQRQLGDAYGVAAQKASMWSKLGWAKKCRAAYERAVELDPKNLEARSSLMAFYQMAPSMLGGGMDKAYVQAEAIKQQNPQRGHVALGTLYAGEQKYGEAFGEFDAALQAEPHHYGTLYQFGRLAALSGQRVDDGIKALQECLALTPPPGVPGHDAAHWRLGNLYEKKGDPDAARAEYRASLAVNPGFEQAKDSLKKLN